MPLPQDTGRHHRFGFNGQVIVSADTGPKSILIERVTAAGPYQLLWSGERSDATHRLVPGREMRYAWISAHNLLLKTFTGGTTLHLTYHGDAAVEAQKDAHTKVNDVLDRLHRDWSVW